MADLLVKRDDLREWRVAPSEAPEPADGEAVLRVESFGLTANNVTYAVFGEIMRYWDFFPAPEGWGRLPTWGFAEVAASRADGLDPGGHVFGYLPSSEHLVVDVADADETGFVDAAEHRAELPSAYQRYLLSSHDPFYDDATEELQMLLRPLFFTSFLLDDDLADGGLAGAGTVVFSSASSKTALAAAFLLAQRTEVEVVGLTSPANAGFVEGLAIYDEVLPYDALESLDRDRAAFVDFSATPRCAGGSIARSAAR